ncbi:hypothetical protein MMC27_005775 [Xylographa pallens]|nr:hypothetical protein [Xylographa pallens]
MGSKTAWKIMVARWLSSGGSTRLDFTPGGGGTSGICDKSSGEGTAEAIGKQSPLVSEENGSGSALEARQYDELSAVLPGQVALPGEPTYSNREDGYYTQQQEELQPYCVVHPTSTPDVSKIVRILRKHDVKFAVRCGGHSSNTGAANIQGGVTVNLRKMDKVTLNPDKTLVLVPGGSKWHDVYSLLEEHGLAASGGRLSDVGVGGLSTGGGISYFSGRYGLVCDNIVGYEVILASGDVVEANQNHNSDLWLALKGGSNNFGIVTRFDLRVFPQGALLGGIILYPPASASQILQGLCQLTAGFDPYAAAIISISWAADTSKRFVFAHFEYTQAETNPRALQPFFGIQPQLRNTMKLSGLTEVAVLASKFSPKGGRSVWATTTVKCDPEFLIQVHELWQGKQTSLESITGLSTALTAQPLPQAFSRNTPRLGGNSLGLDAASDGPLILLLLTAKWTDAADDNHMHTAVKDTLEAIDLAAKAANTYHRFRYLNYAAGWQDPIEGYGGTNRARLQETSRKYDPEGIFQHACPGGFKLFPETNVANERG